MWSKGVEVPPLLQIQLCGHYCKAYHAITTLRRVLLDKLIFAARMKNFPRFMENEHTTQKPTSGPYPELVKSIPDSYNLFFMIHFNMTFPTTARAPK
jgi:hypothetical protein